MTRREWLAMAPTAALAAAETPSIDRFFDDFLRKWVMAEISDEAAHVRIAPAKEGLAGLRRLDRTKLMPEQRLSAEMFEYQLTDIVNEEPYLVYNFPLNQMGSVHDSAPTSTGSAAAGAYLKCYNALSPIYNSFWTGPHGAPRSCFALQWIPGTSRLEMVGAAYIDPNVTPAAPGPPAARPRI